MKKCVVLLVITLLLATTGCRSTPTTRLDAAGVHREMVLPEAADRYQQKPKELFVLPTQIDSPMPTYPHDLAERSGGEVVICVEIAISQEGRVSSVDQMDLGAECAPPGSSQANAFFPLVTGAVEQWTYFAGGTCRYRSIESECDQEGATVQPLPVKLAYKFRFRRGEIGIEQQAGKRGPT